jgi:hypothetical protein
VRASLQPAASRRLEAEGFLDLRQGLVAARIHPELLGIEGGIGFDGRNKALEIGDESIG